MIGDYPRPSRANRWRETGEKIWRVDKAEVIRRGYEVAGQRDPVAARELLAPDAVWHSAIGPMLGKTEYAGYDEIADLVWRQIPSVLADFRPEVLEIRDLGGDMVLAVVRWRATMRTSGLEVDQVFGQLCQVRDGRWREMRSYESVEAAEAAIPEVRARHGYEDWNRGDLDAVVAGTHPDVELVQDPRIPGAETIRGRDALREWLQRFADTWESFSLEPERFVTEGDRTAVVLRLNATARGSGIAAETRIAHVLSFRDGLVHRWRSFTDPDEALQ